MQDTWLALLKGIDGFEGRSTLRTWLFRVLVNIAKTRGVREKRSIPIDMHADTHEPTVSPDRFQSATDRWPGHWVRFPQAWPDTPERNLLAAEALALVRRELDRLPEQQRLVVALRDVEGYDSSEVCALLDLTAANQRVLLHRGRARIREALAGLLRGGVMNRLGRRRLRRLHLPGVRRARDRLPRGRDWTPTPARGSRRTSSSCPGCARYLDQIRATRAGARPGRARDDLDRARAISC